MTRQVDRACDEAEPAYAVSASPCTPATLCKPDNEDEHHQQIYNVPGYDATLRATTGETRRALLKVDFLILPFIMLCFCFLQFDRTNIGNALTDTLAKDMHIDNSDINLAQTLFTVGFIITELPFNLISRYMGPERFLPITMFLWGTVTWAQVFVKNGAGLSAVRFFIGALEGGYIPGFALYISKFYTNDELASRYALFWASNAIAGALGGPLSIGLLSLSGRGGLKGWQWLFLVGTANSLLYLTLLLAPSSRFVSLRPLANDGRKRAFLPVR